MTQLTVKEALEQGFTRYSHEHADGMMWKLENIKPEYFEESVPLRLIEKNGYKFTVSAENIRNLIVEYIDGQDDVYDEEGELGELAAEADFETLAKDINERLAVKTYYSMTDIKLVP